MKKISLMLSILLAFFMLFTGCGKKASSNLKVLRFQNGAEPQTLDPALATGNVEFNIIMQIFEGLTVYDPKDLSAKPGVAEKWTVSEDGTTYTFYLRKNAVWSDGTKITAQTFKDSWLRALDPKTASEYAYQLFYIKGAEDYNSGKGKAEDVAIQVVNDYELKVTLIAPTPYFLSLTSFPTLMPVPLHVISKAGENWTKPENIVCNGPFIIKEWKPQEVIVAAKNDKYWDKAKVKLDQVKFFPYEDVNSALEMYLNGELDYLDSVPTERMEEMLKHPDTVVAPYLAQYFYRINVTKKPLNDRRVRKAISLAINREYIVKYITKAGQIPAVGFVPFGMPGYNNYTNEPLQDVAAAKKLLAEAGYPDGKGFPELTILYNTSEGHQKIAEAIQQDLKKNLNINVKLENQEWKVYLDKQSKLQYDMCRAGWIGDYVDPNTFLDMFVTGGGNNQTGWSNKKYDELIEKAKYEKDAKKRMAIFEEAEKLLIYEQPIIPIYTYVRVYMIKPYVKGFYKNILHIHLFKEVDIVKK